MNENITSVEITFENLDYVAIPAHYFLEFDLEETGEREASLSFVLDKAAEREYDIFDYDLCLPLFQRLVQFNDITSVRLSYADDSEALFSAEWEDDDCTCEHPDMHTGSFNNRYQTSEYTEEGNLRIKIQKH